MRRGFISSILTVVTATACSGDPTGPDSGRCNVRNGAEVCAARAEYGPAQTVVFTTRNTTGGPLYKDGCSTELVGRTVFTNPFKERYDPTLRCGPNPTQADIVANMVELAPGETVQESLDLSFFAFQGFWRVNVWILNADGTLAAATPAFSGIFKVFPSSD